MLGFSERKVANIELNNLKELTLTGSANSSRISKILKNVKPQKLTMDVLKEWGKIDKHFLSWLIKQEQLEHLHIKGESLKIFLNEFPADKLKIQLKKLMIESHSYDILPFPEKMMVKLRRNLITFCQTQKNLEEVVIKIDCSEMCTHLLESKTVKKLKIYTGLPAIELLRVNNTLECLIIMNISSRNFETPKWETLSNLRKLKHLEIIFPDFWDERHDVRDVILNCSELSHLTTLKLTKFYSLEHDPDAFQDINIPSLKEILLRNIYVSPRDWHSITTNCPLVEKVTLDCFVLDVESANSICEKWEYLEEIDLGYGIYSAEIFPALLKCSNLKTLIVLEKMKHQLDLRLENMVIPFKITVKTSNLNFDFVDGFIDDYAYLVDRHLYVENFY
jgi:hypothetical protein